MKTQVRYKVRLLVLIILLTVLTSGCKKDKEKDDVIAPINFNPEVIYGSMTDQDGNTYKTVSLGNLTWMAENLKTTKYRNGDLIQFAAGKDQWRTSVSGLYSSYNNDAEKSKVYGLLYNWYAINDSRNLSPSGWHVATDADWQSLISFIGSSDGDGKKLRESGNSHWTYTETGTDDFGFTALPGGTFCHITFLDYDMGYNFWGMGNSAYWWTSADSTSEEARVYELSDMIYRRVYSKHFGFSVRCVKDDLPGK